jgi:predicted phosphodiesterase
MIFVTGDTHGDYTRFRKDIFPEQKSMTKADYVIICGDFGLWDTALPTTGLRKSSADQKEYYCE